jgi:hypothetical protein
MQVTRDREIDQIYSNCPEIHRMTREQPGNHGKASDQIYRKVTEIKRVARDKAAYQRYSK